MKIFDSLIAFSLLAERRTACRLQARLSRTLRRSADFNVSSQFENLFLQPKTVTERRRNSMIQPHCAVRNFVMILTVFQAFSFVQNDLALGLSHRVAAFGRKPVIRRRQGY